MNETTARSNRVGSIADRASRAGSRAQSARRERSRARVDGDVPMVLLGFAGARGRHRSRLLRRASGRRTRPTPPRSRAPSTCPATSPTPQSTALDDRGGNGFTNGVNGVTVTAVAGRRQPVAAPGDGPQNVNTWFARAIGFKTMTRRRSRPPADRQDRRPDHAGRPHDHPRPHRQHELDRPHERADRRERRCSRRSSPTNTNVALGDSSARVTRAPRCTGANSGAPTESDDDSGADDLDRVALPGDAGRGERLPERRRHAEHEQPDREDDQLLHDIGRRYRPR